MKNITCATNLTVIMLTNISDALQVTMVTQPQVLLLAVVHVCVQVELVVTTSMQIHVDWTRGQTASLATASLDTRVSDHEYKDQVNLNHTAKRQKHKVFLFKRYLINEVPVENRAL